jgi:hypothetical protein
VSDLFDDAPVQLLEAAPYFLVPDVRATAEHYRERFGFEIGRFYGDPPTFTIVSRDGIAICLKEAVAPVPQSCAVPSEGRADAYIWVTDLFALADELRTRGADLVTDPLDQSIYEGRDMQVRDCDGRILVFGQLLD